MAINVDLAKVQQHLEWLKTKLYLDSLASSAKRRAIKRGEVYRCKLGFGIGSEENKERPCLILQGNSANLRSPNTIVAPITHSSSTLPIVVPISAKQDSLGNTLLDGHVLLGNIVTISKARLGDFVAKLSKEEMLRVDKAAANSLDLFSHYTTLNAIIEDKLVYIEKLRSQREELEKELLEKDLKITNFARLRDEYGFKDFKEFEERIRESFSV